jgi:hypothetical protein
MCFSIENIRKPDAATWNEIETQAWSMIMKMDKDCERRKGMLQIWMHIKGSSK